MTSQRQTQSKMARPSRQYFGFRSSRAATALHVSKKTLLFPLIKVSTFICKRGISGLSSPLTLQNTERLRLNIYRVRVPKNVQGVNCYTKPKFHHWNTLVEQMTCAVR